MSKSLTCISFMDLPIRIRYRLGSGPLNDFITTDKRKLSKYLAAS